MFFTLGLASFRKKNEKLRGKIAVFKLQGIIYFLKVQKVTRSMNWMPGKAQQSTIHSTITHLTTRKEMSN